VATPTSVEEYLAGLPDAARMVLEELRRTIAAAAPDASETIAYQMPAFRARGRFLVSYASYTKHCSLFPASEAVRQACGRELEPYLAGKGTIRFKVDDPLPASLVRTIVEARIQEVDR